MRRWVSSNGELRLLVLMGGFALCGGLVVHGSSAALPNGYTWLQPFTTLRALWGQTWVPTALWLVAALGHVRAFRNRRWWVLFVRREPLRLMAMVASVALDRVGSPAHTVVDGLAVAGLVAMALTRRRRLRAVAQRGVEFAVGAFLYAAVSYWYTVLKALVFVDQAPLDGELLAFEKALTGVYPHRVMAAWAALHPQWVAVLEWCYAHLLHQLLATTVFLAAAGDHRARATFFRAMAFCYLLAGPLYLLYPAAGPVYFDPETFAFLHQQRLTVNWLQPMLLRNTQAVLNGQSGPLATWSYIACMPSLHIAQHVVMLVAVRRSPVVFSLWALALALTVPAVVVLGWHYPTDAVAGLALGLVAWWLGSRSLRFSQRMPEPQLRIPVMG